MRIEIYGSAEEMAEFFSGLASETFEYAVAPNQGDTERSDVDVG